MTKAVRGDALVRIASFSAMITPVFFLSLVIFESSLRPGYSQISDEISYLGVGPYELIQNLNFIISGILLIVFGTGLKIFLETKPDVTKARAAGRTVILFGIGVLLAGVTLILASPYPQDSLVAVDYYYFHTLASFVAFIAVIVAQFIVWRGLRKSDQTTLKSYADFSLTTGVISVILLVIFLFTMNSGYKGLTERMFVAVPLIWTGISGVRMFSSTLELTSSVRGQSAQE